MKQGTHIVTATAINMAVFRPTTFKDLALVISLSTIGSIISDIDVTTSKSHKDLEKIIITSFISIVLCSIIEVYYNIGIFNWLKENTLIAKNLALILIFFCICFWGMHQPHRTFMHSIPCAIILSSILYFIYPILSIYFCFAMLTHIFLDLFNKKKIQLFYPIKKKSSLNLCESDGKTNKAIFQLGSLLCLIEIILLSTTSII